MDVSAVSVPLFDLTEVLFRSDHNLTMFFFQTLRFKSTVILVQSPLIFTVRWLFSLYQRYWWTCLLCISLSWTFNSCSKTLVVSNEPIPSLSPHTDPSSLIAREFNMMGLALGTGGLALFTDAEIEAQIVPDIFLETLLEASIEPALPSSSYPNTTQFNSQSPGLNPLSLLTHTLCC